MNVMTETTDHTPEKQLKGWHVLIIMLGFFGVMFAVNGVFLYHAITSFPGEDVKKSYLQGLSYNKTLAERSQQAELGWTAEAGFREDTLMFRLTDQNGQALSAHLVIVELRRSATDTEDRELSLQPTGQGVYEAPLAELISGQWLARFTVFDQDGEQVLFRANKTLRVP